MNEISSAMIFAAGIGSRLLNLSERLPKPLMEYAAKPIIFHLIEGLIDLGIKQIFINTHYLADILEKSVRSKNYNCSIYFSYEKELLGTAGGLRKVVLDYNINTKIIALHGDIYCDLNILKNYSFNDFVNLIMAKNHEVLGYDGSLSIDEDNNINELGRYYKKNGSSKSRGFFTGIHILSARAIDLLKKSEDRCLVSEVYPTWLKADYPIKGIEAVLDYEDLGSPERLWQTNMRLLANLELIAKGFSRNENWPQVWQGPNVNISKKVVFSGPVLLGEGVYIADYSRLQNVVIGPRAQILEGAVLNNTVLMSDTCIKKGEELDCMIVHPHARFLVKPV